MPRSVIQNIEQTHHGAFDFAELECLGLCPDDVIDFSANINPYGPSPAVREAIENTSYKDYPDREALALRRALSSHLGAAEEQIMLGNGSAELLWLAAFAYIHPGDKVLIITPTFGEYERVSLLMGGLVTSCQANAGKDFAIDMSAVDQLLQDAQYRIVFLCNPNNPTGQLLPLDVLSAWAQAYPETLFIVDEAYLPFVPNAISSLSLDLENILVMRSMTKDYALAGLRLGYAVGAPQVIQGLNASSSPWHVNTLAQAAGLAALQDEEHLQKTLVQIRSQNKALINKLKTLGYKIVPSKTHYFLIKVGNGKSFRSRLLKEGIQVRDCASFGIPEYIRVSTRLPEENERLLDALRKIAKRENL